MKVRMLTSVQGPALRCKFGEIVDIDEALAQRYIAKGQAESVAATTAKPKPKPAPEPETAAVDPALEQAIKKRGRPRKKT